MLFILDVTGGCSLRCLMRKKKCIAEVLGRLSQIINRPFANLFVIEYQIIWNTWKSPRKTVGAQEICQITERMFD